MALTVLGKYHLLSTINSHILVERNPKLTKCESSDENWPTCFSVHFVDDRSHPFTCNKQAAVI
mgnify:CR=1 FL=1